MTTVVGDGIFTLARLERLRTITEDAACLGNAAVHQWGVDAQTRMALEEMGELIVSLCQEPRGRATEHDVRGEIADVLITTLQLVAIYGVDATLDRLADKTTRLRARLIAAREVTP